MIIQTETGFDITKQSEITETFNLTETQVKSIVQDFFLGLSYKDRKEFLDEIGAEKIG